MYSEDSNNDDDDGFQNNDEEDTMRYKQPKKTKSTKRAQQSKTMDEQPAAKKKKQKKSAKSNISTELMQESTAIEPTPSTDISMNYLKSTSKLDLGFISDRSMMTAFPEGRTTSLFRPLPHCSSSARGENRCFHGATIRIG